MSAATEIAMFESGWFGRGDAFRQRIKMSDAKAAIQAFIDQQRPLRICEPLNLIGGFEEEEPDLLDPDHLHDLVLSIETRFGQTDHDQT